MTTDQPEPQKDQNRSIERTVAPPGQSTPASPAAGDLTARARIRDAAIRHFADDGYERTTIRGIAATAGVSPGLLRHHFGSKEELRRACDEHIAETMRRINAQYLDDMGGAAADRRHGAAVRALHRPRPGRELAVGGGDLRRDGDDDRALARAGRRGPARPAGRGPQDPGRADQRHGVRRPAAARAVVAHGRGRHLRAPKAGAWSPSGCSTSTPTRSSAPKTPPRGRRESTDRAEPGTVRSTDFDLSAGWGSAERKNSLPAQPGEAAAGRRSSKRERPTRPGSPC